VYDVLGIEAARQAIYNELAEVIEFDGTYINYHHLCLLCDRMTYTNKLISIFRHGINNDNVGPIAKASFEETPEMFLKAARHAELDIMRGISANVMCGQEGFYGTSAFQVVLDIEKMKLLQEKHIEHVNADDALAQMFSDLDLNDSEQNKCGPKTMTINNNVTNIKCSDLGDDNEYNPGF
jgi:DNA-directed RNA polymerase II subunit RPB1